jgi:hypothetical protein
MELFKIKVLQIEDRFDKNLINCEYLNEQIENNNLDIHNIALLITVTSMFSCGFTAET